MKCPDCGTALQPVYNKRKVQAESTSDKNGGLVLHTEKRCIEVLKKKLTHIRKLGAPLVRYMNDGTYPHGALLLCRTHTTIGDVTVSAEELTALADVLRD